MNTIDSMRAGVMGVQNGMNKLNQNVAEIAQAPSGADLTKPMVNMLSNEHQIKASAKVIQASSDMVGTLLDIRV